MRVSIVRQVNEHEYIEIDHIIVIRDLEYKYHLDSDDYGFYEDRVDIENKWR